MATLEKLLVERKFTNHEQAEVLKPYPGNYSEEELVKSCREAIDAYKRGEYKFDEQIKWKNL